MKPFIVLLFFITFLVLFAGAAMSGSDLTPNTSPAQEGGGSSTSLVQGVRSSACTDPYIVRSGDTLSGIASLCAVTLADLLAVNPAITNPDLIQIDQQIRIPGGSTVPQPAQPTATPRPTATPQPTQAAPTSDVQPTLVVPTSTVQPTPVPAQPTQPVSPEQLQETLDHEAFKTASAGW